MPHMILLTCADNSISCQIIVFLLPVCGHSISDLWSDQSSTSFKVRVRNRQFQILACYLAFSGGKLGLYFLCFIYFLWLAAIGFGFGAIFVLLWGWQKSFFIHFAYRLTISFCAYSQFWQCLHTFLAWGLGQAEQQCTHVQLLVLHCTTSGASLASLNVWVFSKWRKL